MVIHPNELIGYHGDHNLDERKMQTACLGDGSALHHHLPLASRPDLGVRISAVKGDKVVERSQRSPCLPRSFVRPLALLRQIQGA